MSARFASASSQVLRNSSPPVTAYPFTVAMWAYPIANLTTQTLWALEPAVGTNGYTIFKDATNGWVIHAPAASSTITNGVSLNAWQFLVARFISATNRRLALLGPDGKIQHVQDVTNVTSSPTVEEIGGGSSSGGGETFFDGLIGEYWKTNTDIQADGGQLQDEVVRLLAKSGPFAIPHIAQSVVDYRPLRQALAADTDILGEYFSGRFGRQPWVNINGVERGAHPPIVSALKQQIPRSMLQLPEFDLLASFSDTGDGYHGPTLIADISVLPPIDLVAEFSDVGDGYHAPSLIVVPSIDLSLAASFSDVSAMTADITFTLGTLFASFSDGAAMTAGVEVVPPPLPIVAQIIIVGR